MANTTYQKKKEEALAKLRELVHFQDQAGLKKVRQTVEHLYNGNIKGCKLPKQEVARRDMDLGNYFACLIEARIAFENGNRTKENEEINQAFLWSEKLSKSQTNLEMHRADILHKQERRNAAIKTGVKRSLKSLFLAGVVGAAGIGLYKGAKAGINAMSSADIDREATKKNNVTQIANAGGTIINNNQTSINVKKNATNQSIQQGGTGSGGTQRAHLSSPADDKDSDVGGMDGGSMTYTRRLNQNVNSSMDQVTTPKPRGQFAAEYTARVQRNVLSDLDVHGSDNAAHIAGNMVAISDADRAIHNNDLQKGVDHFRAVEDAFDCVEGMADSTADIARDVTDTTREIHMTLEGLKNMFNFRR